MIRIFLGIIAILLLPRPSLAEPAKACSQPLEACIAEKWELYQNRGVLGFSWSAVAEGEPAPPGSFVVRATPPGYPAHSAGLQLGDLLLSIQGKPLAGVTREELERWLETIRVGETVILEIARHGNKQIAVLEAGKPDSQTVDAWVGQHVRRDHGDDAFRRYLRELRPKGRRGAVTPQ